MFGCEKKPCLGLKGLIKVKSWEKILYFFTLNSFLIYKHHCYGYSSRFRRNARLGFAFFIFFLFFVYHKTQSRGNGCRRDFHFRLINIHNASDICYKSLVSRQIENP